MDLDPLETQQFINDRKFWAQYVTNAPLLSFLPSTTYDTDNADAEDDDDADTCVDDADERLLLLPLLLLLLLMMMIKMMLLPHSFVGSNFSFKIIQKKK